MLKKKNIFYGIILVSILIVIGLGAYFFNVISEPFKETNSKVTVNVNDGDSLYTVLENLNKENKIKNLFVSKVYIKTNKVEGSIKKGEYEFDSDISLKQLISDLSSGKNNKNLVKITIPEGYTAKDIALLLDKKDVIDKEEFLNACNTRDSFIYTKNLDKDNVKNLLEGYLYPDTYEFLKGTSGEKIIDTMLKRFNIAIKDIDKNINESRMKEIITIASIIEKEAGNSEKSKVASVFYNRINKKMKLQSCATVLYAMGKHKDKLYYNDLKIKSPYNTYMISKLPPGPICNPGRDSILAALHPKKTKYLFFVSLNNGKHFFTDKYEEFLKVKSQTQGN